MTNLVNNILSCEENIIKTCTTDFPIYNKTFVKDCFETNNKFTNEVNNCFNLTKTSTVDVACNCWDKVDLDSVKKCNKIEESKSIGEALKECTNKFGQCKKYEDEVSYVYADCSGNFNHFLTTDMQ